MTTTLSTAIANVRSLVDEPAAAFWSNTELKRWINEACKDIARRLETKQAIATINAVVNQQNYTLPADVYRIHKVTFTPVTANLMYTLEYRGLMEMDQIWGINKNWPGSYPLNYTLWNNPPKLQMITYPITQTPGKFTVYYFQHIVTAATTATNIDVLPGYEDLVYDYAAYRALRKDSNPMWKTHQAVYEAKLADMKDRTRTYQDQAGTFSTGQSALPLWLTAGTTTWGF